MDQPDIDRLDVIRLSGVRAYGYHGVFAQEKREGQEFSVDVALHVDTRPAARTDDVARTVDYGVVAEAVTAVVTGDPLDLIETLCQRIADAVLAFDGVQVVDVTVHKPHAPITVPFDDVTVSIRRTTGRVGGGAGR